MNQKTVKRIIFQFFLWAGISFLIIRLIDIQVIRGYQFRQLADKNRFYALPVEAHRGVFLDRFGDSLTWNSKQFYRLDIPESLYPEKTAISREEAMYLMASDSAQVVSQHVRKYRFGQVLSHILGYVGQVTAEDLEREPLLPLYKQIGRSGLESVFEDQLQGIDGQVVYEIDAMGHKQRLVRSTPAKPGQNIQLAIDPYLSQVAFEHLVDQKGTVIISDAQTGQILTMVSKPSFDPNLMSSTFHDPQQEEQRKQTVRFWFNDQDLPFFNRAVAGMYPPGSVFKLVTALAGLENQKIDRNTTVVDEGVLKVGEYEFRSWLYWNYGRADGEISLVRAIARSNDIYFYKVAEWVGPNALAKMAEMFGFGQATELELSGQARGIVPNPAWKELVIGEPWYLGNTYHFGIGQGDILVSPLQIAQMVQAVANQGTLCPPSLVLQQQANTCYEVGLQKQNVDLVLEGMIDACSPDGTAFPFFSHNKNLKQDNFGVEQSLQAGAVACKTGTAEFGGRNEEGYRNTHGWFVVVADISQVTNQARQQYEQEQDTVSSQDERQSETSTTEEEGEESGEESGEDRRQENREEQSEDGQHSDTTGLSRTEWLQKIAAAPYPREIVITVLVESDQDQPFKEGSEHAAPVAKGILDWIWGDSEQ